MKDLLAGFLVSALVPVAVGAETGHNLKTDDALLDDLRTASDPQCREERLVALSDRSSEPVRLALESIVTNTAEPNTVRMQAICALAGSATRANVPLLLDIVEDDLVKRRGFWACAIPLLGDLKDRRAVSLLKRIADLNEEHLAGMDHMAIVALAGFGDAREVAFLEEKAHIWAVRVAVFKALARIAEPSSVAVLVSGLQAGEEAQTVATAQQGLLAIGAPARSALEAVLRSPADDLMKMRAAALLQEIGQ